MEWLTIKRDDKRTRKLFFRYFNHEWFKKLSNRKAWFFIYPLAVILFIYNLVNPADRDDYNFYFIRFCLISILSYLPALYLFQLIRLIVSVRKISVETPVQFQFRFDEEGVFYRAEDENMTQKWTEFKYYSVNKNDVYLYNEKGRLRELLSEEIIGFINFNAAMDVIQSKLVPRYS